MIPLFGADLVARIRDDIALDVEALGAKGIRPRLVVFLVGDDDSGASYRKSIVKAAERSDIEYEERFFPVSVSTAELVKAVAEQSHDPMMHGILLQTPLPPHIDANIVADAIDPSKDIDGLGSCSVGRLQLGLDCFPPATAEAVVRLAEFAEFPFRGAHAVVLGRSNIVGKPCAALLLQRDATVTICHSRTRDLWAVTQKADLVVVGVGKAEFFGKKYFRPDAFIIDVGIHVVEGRLVGDVDGSVMKFGTGRLTPVPGGVGPVTTALLMEHVVTAAKRVEMSSKVF